MVIDLKRLKAIIARARDRPVSIIELNETSISPRTIPTAENLARSLGQQLARPSIRGVYELVLQETRRIQSSIR